MPRGNKTWLEKYGKPCKLGTIPAVVRVHGKDKVTIGGWVRVQECENDKWKSVLVTEVHDDGYFKADR